MTKRNSVNETADNIIKSYLTNPHVAELAERLRNIPMTCPTCHTKGLVKNGEPNIVQRRSGEDLVIEIFNMIVDCGETDLLRLVGKAEA